MPKKSSRNSKVIRKSSWKTKILKSTSDEKKIVSNIHIGAGNARRWIILKKKLDYQNDVDFVAYLLDLAEPLSGGKNTHPVQKGEDQNDDSDTLTAGDVQQEDTDDSCLIKSIGDGEWQPTNSGALRRSPRTQNPPIKLHVRRSTRNNLENARCSQKTSTIKNNTKGTNNNLGEDLNGSASTEFTETDVSISDEIKSQNSHNVSVVTENVLSGGKDLHTQRLLNETASRESDKNSKIWLNDTFCDVHLGNDKIKSSTVTLSPLVVLENVMQPLDIGDSEPNAVLIEVGERVKLKRRKRRRSHITDEDGEKEELLNKKNEYFHNSKHRKKKHKHGDHNVKKYVPIMHACLMFAFLIAHALVTCTK